MLVVEVAVLPNRDSGLKNPPADKLLSCYLVPGFFHFPEDTSMIKQVKLASQGVDLGFWKD